MAITEHVSLTITPNSVGLARAGFGVPLVLSATASFPQRSRAYTDLAGALVDFPAGTAEARAAQALFSQSPHPVRIRIGRSALKPTQVWTLSVGTVRNSHVYSVVVTLDDGSTATASFTSISSAADGDIVVGLVAALNGVTGNNYIAAGTTSPFTVTADAAGDWFSLEVNADDLSASQTHADPGVATDLAAIALESNDWYELVTLYNSDAYVKAAAGWIESNKRLYQPDVSETIAVNVAADGTQGTGDDIKTLSYSRTGAFWHHNLAEMASAAMAGKVLPLEPGSETRAYKTLVGVTPSVLTATQRLNLDARNMTYYKAEAGVGITWEGKTAGWPSGNAWLDVTRGLDWFEDDMSKGVLGVLIAATKVPFTDSGIARIVAQVRASLRRAEARNIIDAGWSVTFPLVADISDADKAARLLRGIGFQCTLAGAVHRVAITGTVSN